MSTPNPFGLDALLGRYQPTQLGGSAVLGNPQAQQAQQENMAQLLEAYKQAQSRSQTGAALMQPQYVQNSGGLGALAMIAQAAAGKHIQKKADETAAEYAQRIGEAEMLSQRQQAEAAAAADERKFQRLIERDARKTGGAERIAQMRIDEANKRAEMSANARIKAAQIAAGGQGGNASVLSADEATALGLAPGTVAQRDRNGKLSVVQGPPKSGGSADQQKKALYDQGLADDAYNYAAAHLGLPPEQVRAMSPQEIRDAVAKGGRWSSGPIVGSLPLLGSVANADLLAYSQSAAGKKARLNNPAGPVTNADFVVAEKSIFSPSKPDKVNADLIFDALTKSGAGQNKSQQPDNNNPLGLPL